MPVNLWERGRDLARKLKADTYALYLACKDPRVPWYARLLAGGVVAYVCSPIDLIPDAIPIFGYLDDVVIVVLGITLVLRLIPSDIMEEHRAQARECPSPFAPANRVVAALFILIWLLAAIGVGWWIWRMVGHKRFLVSD